MDERPSYLKYAFANVYNLSLLGGVAVASAATGDWAIGVIAAGVEALWLFIGADTAPFRRWVDRQHRQKLADAARERRRVRILSLTAMRDREKAIDLVAAHRDMGRDLDKNEHWQGELIRNEYARLEELLDAYVELAEAAIRIETYAAGFDPNRLRKDLAAQQRLAQNPQGDPEARALAGRNAELLEKRISGLEEMGRLVQRTRGQMSVIENTFSLLRDQVVSLKPPQDIHSQLNEINAGVDAIRTVLAEGNGGLAAVAEAPATEAAEAERPGERVR